MADAREALFREFDEWCAKQAEAVNATFERGMERGLSLRSPEMRALWGQSHAYMRMRSYLSGARKHTPEQPR